MAISKEQAFESAVSSANFLANLVQPTGKFIYGYDRISREPVKGYNILRHIGCVWAMLDVYKETEDLFLLEQSKKAIDWMLKNRMTKFANRLVIVEKGHTKIGAAGLSVLALLRYNEIAPNKKYFGIAEKLCSYISYCMEESGELKFMKRRMKDNYDTGLDSEFYPGECALALCNMGVSCLSPSNGKDYLDSAHKIISYYEKVRDQAHHIRDHWMMQAMEFFDPEFLEYAFFITLCEMGNRLSIKAGPTACRSEAMLAYHNMTEGSGQQKIVLNFVEDLLTRQRSCQILHKKDQDYGAFLWSPKDNTIRNDVQQHNISSFLRYYRLKSQ